MNCLVGGPLLVRGLGPGHPGPLKSGPAVSLKTTRNFNIYFHRQKHIKLYNLYQKFLPTKLAEVKIDTNYTSYGRPQNIAINLVVSRFAG